MTRLVTILSSRMIATAFLMLICAAARAASPHRYEVSVDDSLDRLAVRACFGGKAPEALVLQFDGARFYLESMRLGGRPVFLVGATPYNWSGVVAFGHFAQRDVQVPGAVLHLALLDAPTTVQQAQLET